MINRIELIGNIGADAEQRTTSSGTTYTKFTVATNENFKDSSGNWQTTTEWHTVKVWGFGADNALKRCKKGKRVYVDGKMKSYKTDDDVRLWEVRCNIFKILDKEDREDREQPTQSYKAFDGSQGFGENTPRPSWGAPIK